MRFTAFLHDGDIELVATSIDETNAKTKGGVILMAADRIERAIMRRGSTSLLRQIKTPEIVEAYAEFVRTSLESRKGSEQVMRIENGALQDAIPCMHVVYADGRERKGLRLSVRAIDDAQIAQTDSLINSVFNRAA